MTFNNACKLATHTRQGDGLIGGSPKLVARTGIIRSIPGASQTTHTRPKRALVVIPIKGKVRL